ncbi:MAG TPA: hypothetical protein VGJ61_06445 [Solirubrobacterales bacterium]
MAGVAEHPHGRPPARTRLPAALAAVGLFALLFLLATGTASPNSAEAAKASQSCPAQPLGLAPPGPGPTRFTMMIRINTQGNVDTYTKPDGGMGGRIRPQDIFVLNTRFGGSGSFPAMTPTVANDLAAQLNSAFPCNRIIALNGMSYDPTQAGYAFTLLDNPLVFALLTDFEQDDWNDGRLTDPARPVWTSKFTDALPRIKAWDFGLASAAVANPVGVGKRTGLAPQDIGTWNYGQIAQDLNKKNSRLGAPKLGPLSVQAQDACADGAAGGFGARAKQLRLQYTFKFVTKKIKVKGKKKKMKKTIRLPLKKQAKPITDNLAMEISFTESPEASASQAILSTSAAQAAACVPPALKQGVGAFFFFASDDSMRLLFQQPQIDALRPPTGGSTGGVTPGGN